jgi:beta-glucosidase/6-phospho-beta-glucosidase/beta-galactosidase
MYAVCRITLFFKVKHWITFNEPFDFCTDGYGNGVAAPLINASGIGEYICGHHVLLSHAAIYRLYDNTYRATQNGKIGMTLNSRYYYLPQPNAAGSLKEDPIIERALQYRLGWLAHPIFGKEGGYPPVMVEEIAKSSAAEGRAWSRLPTLTDEQRELVKGAADFFGFNYYTSRMVEKKTPGVEPPSWQKDLGLTYKVNESWPIGKSTW